MTGPLLEGRGITKRFGGLVALEDVGFSVARGEIVGLIGPNGSGKTTLFDCLTRVASIDAGAVTFKGKDITHAKPHSVSRLGLSRTFQVIRVYDDLSVRDNLLLSRRWDRLGPLSMLRRAPRELHERAGELMGLLLLDSVADDKARSLSGGQRRLLEIGMALMPEPDLMLLDEATSGVNPTLIETIKDRIRRLNASGLTFLLVEHDIRFISDLCRRVVVLNQGHKLAEGTPDQIKADDRVIEAYFGRDAHGHGGGDHLVE